MSEIREGYKEIQLLSIMETDNIIIRTENFKLTFSRKILFNDKAELKKVIRNKFRSEEEILILTEQSQDCGAVKINSISQFNSEFKFTDDPVGIITLINVEINKKLVLDFYEENGEKFIEIEEYDNE